MMIPTAEMENPGGNCLRRKIRGPVPIASVVAVF